MKYLFTESGLKVLESLCFTRTLFAFDFDGTLSPIVSDPNHARMQKRTALLFENLQRSALTAVISGRSLEDLRGRLGATSPSYLVGNHGLEGIQDQSHSQDNAKDICGSWDRILKKKIELRGQDRGIQLENKIFSLAVHYRHSRNKKETKLSLLAEMSELDPSPRIILGKSVINLIPPGAPHKGIALLRLMQMTDTQRAFYIGDDDTDEDVFSLPDSRIFTVRVGNKKASHAQFFIRTQAEIQILLNRLSQYHDNLEFSE